MGGGVDEREGGRNGKKGEDRISMSSGLHLMR